MQKWRLINKSRLETFTDALIAIIMTVLVLDLKVPEFSDPSGKQLAEQIRSQLPHFFGFIISFSTILSLWISHHDLFESLKEVTRTFALLNFLFVASVAIIPFSTAMASEYPSTPFAVAVLSINMFIMGFFLTFLHIYSIVNDHRVEDHFPKWYTSIKRKMGIGGLIILLCSAFVAYLSTTVALIMIAIVPAMHCIPLREKRRQKEN